MTIVEFLQARLDEDEAIVRAAIADDGGPEDAVPEDIAPKDSGWLTDGTFLPRFSKPLAEKFGRFADSRRLLREISAKRAVVELHSSHWSGACWSCSGDHGADPTPAPCDTLRALAAVYADHSDFQHLA